MKSLSNMIGWTTEILGKNVLHKKGYAFKSSWFIPSGTPVIKVSNFTNNSIETNGLEYVNDIIAKSKSEFSVNKNDVIIQTVGSWPNNPNSVVGKVIKVPNNLDGALLNQNAVVLFSTAKIQKEYFYWLLKENSFKGYIINTAQGAANQASITLDSIFRYQFYLPPIKIQLKIAAILSAYDDLIENNNKQIALLEKMAEEIYKEWFVRMRFPGYKQTKFVKGIPEGWNKIPIEKLCENIRKGIKRKNIKPETRYIGLEHIPQNKIALTSFANIYTVDSDKLVFEERDILFAKIRPYLHKVALSHFSGVCSSDTIVIRPRRKIFEAFVFFTVFSDTFVELATISSKGTKMPRADWDFLKKLEVILPTEDFLSEFQISFDKMFEQTTNLLKQNELLVRSRDLLLPRLLSGKLNVENLDIKFPPSMES